MIAASIRADDLHLLLAAERMRKWTNGRTCSLCALSTGGATIEVDCHRRRPRASELDGARRFGPSPVHVSLLKRGHIASLIQRTQRRDRKEVRRTWGAGIRALLAEPQHVLRGGTA